MPETSFAIRLKRRFRAVFTRSNTNNVTRSEQNLRAPYFLTGQIAAPAGIQKDVQVEMPIVEIPIHVPRQSLKLESNTLSGSVDLLEGEKGRIEVWQGHGNKQIYKTELDSSFAWSVPISTKGTILIKAISKDIEEVTQLLLMEEGTLQVVTQTVTISSRRIELYDIYGQPSTNSHSDGSLSSTSSTRECIACLSNARDTVVLPCRHMCLCSACAEGVRSRTDRRPLCRQHFTGFLHLSNLSLPSTQ